jgi:hypothetical protein
MLSRAFPLWAARRRQSWVNLPCRVILYFAAERHGAAETAKMEGAMQKK